MKQVNFLPAEVRQREVRGRLLPVLLFSALLGVLAVGAGWFSLQQIIDSTRESEQRLTQVQPTSHNDASTQLADQHADADLVARVKQLNTLSASEIDWPRFFAGLDALTPKDIHIASLTYAFSQGNGTLQLGGTAPSNLSFATFVESLKGNKFLAQSKVGGYAYDPLKGSVTFSIAGQVPLAQIGYPSSSKSQ